MLAPVAASSRAVWVLLALASVGCKRPTVPDAQGRLVLDIRHNPDGSGTAAVRFGTDSVTREELEKKFSEMSPAARANYQTVERRRGFAEDMTRFELLAQEAARQGLADDAEVRDAVKQALVRRLLVKTLSGPEERLSNEVVKRFYEEHLADFVKPEAVRLLVLHLAAPLPDSPKRTAARAHAEALWKKTQALEPTDLVAFQKLVRENSQHEPTRVLGGDTRFRTRDELAQDFGQAVAEATPPLTKIGELAPLVETPQGFDILKFDGRRAALNLALTDPQVRQQIESRLQLERRNNAYAALLANLKTRAGYQVDDAVLARIRVDPSAPMVHTVGPSAPPMPIPAPTGARAGMPVDGKGG